MMSPAIATHEQLGLVALSVAVAIVAGYLALDLAQRSADATGVMRRAWIVAGGVTIGLGIWSMHFIGMLAMKMAMPVSYDLPLVALSMVAAIGGSVIALAVVVRRDAGRRGLFFAAGFLGLAVASMHYLGMASMEMEADISWNAPLVALSLLIAFGASSPPSSWSSSSATAASAWASPAAPAPLCCSASASPASTTRRWPAPPSTPK